MQLLPIPSRARRADRPLRAGRRMWAAALPAVLAAAALLTGGVPAAAADTRTYLAALAETLCDKYASTRVDGGRYIVQNNVWGADTRQCIEVNGTSFRVTTADHNNSTSGAPAGYPSIYVGCHYRNCTTGSGLPVQVSRMNTATSSWQTSSPSTGVYNVAYDLWYDADPNAPAQNDAELMIWLKYRGNVQPIGQRVATGVSVAGATWDIWQGNIGWNVISFIRTTPTDSVSGLDLTAFTDVAVARGAVRPEWYLTSIQAGFEPWQGGAGLATHSFSATVT
ncbi:GH12 family glycosyl hydrolase domain-containing protein [Streptomonospora nanhaiensis]|uniref:GH12 family glycosyl hydrolase domain-containing protein n=1 Tax=Streptomonospora nanhaiensis TaxID=1323731 RepID=UPI001C383FAF|nr:hypothetical protein [Streptomonospora nanhaiensis]MBV2366566.1 hypothetical protein [Streptomonospora nanhaiensis]